MTTLTFKGLVAKTVVGEMAQLAMCFPYIKICVGLQYSQKTLDMQSHTFNFINEEGERWVFVGLTVPISNLQILLRDRVSTTRWKAVEYSFVLYEYVAMIGLISKLTGRFELDKFR